MYISCDMLQAGRLHVFSFGLAKASKGLAALLQSRVHIRRTGAVGPSK
jgi:hypothetical protein